jgi:hypothetical protein
MADEIEKTETEKSLLREKMSKRITGVVLIAAGLGMSVFLFFKSIGVVVVDPDTAKSIINGLLLAGSAMLGIDAAQNVFKGNKQ